MELFDVLREDGTKTGLQKERADVHRDGDIHGSVHIWLVREGSVLLQKRAGNKDSFPNCYDVASSGHIDAGEDALTAAVREVGEEINLSISKTDLIPLFTQQLRVNLPQKDGRFISNEYNTVYLLRKELDLDTLKRQKSEIDSLIWMPMPDLLHALRENDKNFCISLQECERVFSYYVNYKRLVQIVNELQQGMHIKEVGRFTPKLYIHKVEEAEFGCEGREEGNPAFGRLCAFSMQGEQMIPLEDSLLRNSNLDDHMWLGTIRVNGKESVVAVKEQQNLYEQISDEIVQELFSAIG